MKMKLLKSAGLGLAALLLGTAGPALAQTADYTIATFDTDINNVGNWYGSGQYSWDSSQDATGNGGGSLHILCPDDASSDTPLNPFICISGGNPWYDAGSLDLTLYKSVEFDVRWDNSAALTLGQFNDCSTWPAQYGSLSNNFNGDPASLAFNLKAVNPTGSPQRFIQLGATNIPAAAISGWVHVSFPINPTIAGISHVNGIDFEKWIRNNSMVIGQPTGKFWIDNIILKGTAAPPPPPTMLRPQKAVAGLNLTAITGPYTREQIKSVSDQTWIGHGSTPVTYSFTIKQGVDGTSGIQFQNHIFLIPSPGTETAPDWNEPQTLMMDLESQTSGGTMWTFRYKTNQPNNNNMIYDNTVVPATLTNSTLTGTWTLSVVNDNQFTMMSPDGGTTNFTVDLASMQLIGASPVTAYFGVQCGNTAGIGARSVLSEVKITGTANPLDDKFANDSTLDTSLWINNSGDPGNGLILIPGASPLQWAYWTVPAAGFSLQTGPSLTGFTDASPVVQTQFGSTMGALVPLVSGNEFFRTIKRVPYQLQVLLPGETNAPGTVSGKIGSPNPVSLGAGGGVDVTVNMCDSTWHIVNSSDIVHITSSDGSATLPLDSGLVNGTYTFTTFSFGSTSSPTFTITATDIINPPPAILDNTSSPVVVGP